MRTKLANRLKIFIIASLRFTSAKRAPYLLMLMCSEGIYRYMYRCDMYILQTNAYIYIYIYIYTY